MKLQSLDVSKVESFNLIFEGIFDSYRISKQVVRETYPVLSEKKVFLRL